MGYYVTLENSTFNIPADKLDEAFARLKALNHKPGIEKRGGSFSGGKYTAKWFSWMSEKYDEEATDAEDIFKMLGFETECNPDDGLTLVGYDSKTGQEALFIDEVADLAVPGWVMEWRGEDDTCWRQTAKGEEVGKTLYPSEIQDALTEAYVRGAQLGL